VKRNVLERPLESMDSQDIRSHIRKYYTRFFQQGQQRGLPVQTGRSLARALGYPIECLDFVQEEDWRRFIPCGNPLPFLSPAAGDRVLNLGCGIGVDSYALCSAHSAPVDIIGMDVVFGILREVGRLSSLCKHHGATLHWVCGDGLHLPFLPESFEWVIMNGVFNLFPEKNALLREVRRALKPSGRFVCSDLCRTIPLPDYFIEEPDSWAWCMSGAPTEEELGALIDESSFELLGLIKEEEEDMLYRVTFTCRKTA
jgi:arsenite methyltransferase